MRKSHFGADSAKFTATGTAVGGMVSGYTMKCPAKHRYERPETSPGDGRNYRRLYRGRYCLLVTTTDGRRLLRDRYLGDDDQAGNTVCPLHRLCNRETRRHCCVRLQFIENRVSETLESTKVANGDGFRWPIIWRMMGPGRNAA